MMPISRQALEEAFTDADYRLEQGGLISPPYYDPVLAALTNAAQAILDGEPLDWCVVHEAEREGSEWCHSSDSNVNPCRFESQVRIPVAP